MPTMESRDRPRRRLPKENERQVGAREIPGVGSSFPVMVAVAALTTICAERFSANA